MSGLQRGTSRDACHFYVLRTQKGKPGVENRPARLHFLLSRRERNSKQARLTVSRLNIGKLVPSQILTRFTRARPPSPIIRGSIGEHPSAASLPQICRTAAPAPYSRLRKPQLHSPIDRRYGYANASSWRRLDYLVTIIHDRIFAQHLCPQISIMGTNFHPVMSKNARDHYRDRSLEFKRASVALSLEPGEIQNFATRWLWT